MGPEAARACHVTDIVQLQYLLSTIFWCDAFTQATDLYSTNIVFFSRDLIPRGCVSQGGPYVDNISVAGHLEGHEWLPLLLFAFVEYGYPTLVVWVLGIVR